MYILFKLLYEGAISFPRALWGSWTCRLVGNELPPFLVHVPVCVSMHTGALMLSW